MFDGQKVMDLGNIAEQLHILQVNCILIKQFLANPHVRIYMQSSHDETKSNVMWLALYDAGADPGGEGAPPKIGKNKKCWRKIVIFHTKYPKNVRASLRSAQFF